MCFLFCPSHTHTGPYGVYVCVVASLALATPTSGGVVFGLGQKPLI